MNKSGYVVKARYVNEPFGNLGDAIKRAEALWTCHSHYIHVISLLDNNIVWPPKYSYAHTIALEEWIRNNKEKELYDF